MSGVRAPQWPLMKKPKVVVIGGGTGTYSTLLALKNLSVKTTAIVSMADSGGSNRVIRDEFGLLPTSDIRQAMVALSSPDANHLLRQLFTYRYNQGIGISGMTFGNLFMAALTDILGSQTKAISATCKLLKVKGRVIPITFDNSHLLAKYSNGKQILGEHQIDEIDDKQGRSKIVSIEMIPRATANPQALKAILSADFIILPPGDLYTSLIATILVDGIGHAICTSPAKKIFFVNLMTRFGQTNNFNVSHHIDEISHYLGRDCLDYSIINDNHHLPSLIKGKYKEEKAKLVDDDLASKRTYRGSRLIRADLLSNLIYQKQDSDKLTRSLVRHDPAKMTTVLNQIMVK